MIRLGCPRVLTFDWCRDASKDLPSTELRGKIKKIVRSGRILSLAPRPFVLASTVTPPVRSAKYPRGIPGLRHSMRLKSVARQLTQRLAGRGDLSL